MIGYRSVRPPGKLVAPPRKKKLRIMLSFLCQNISTPLENILRSPMIRNLKDNSLRCMSVASFRCLKITERTLFLVKGQLNYGKIRCQQTILWNKGKNKFRKQWHLENPRYELKTRRRMIAIDRWMIYDQLKQDDEWSQSFVVLFLTHILGFQDVIVFRNLFFTLLNCSNGG